MGNLASFFSIVGSTQQCYLFRVFWGVWDYQSNSADIVLWHNIIPLAKVVRFVSICFTFKRRVTNTDNAMRSYYTHILQKNRVQSPRREDNKDSLYLILFIQGQHSLEKFRRYCNCLNVTGSLQIIHFGDVLGNLKLHMGSRTSVLM